MKEVGILVGVLGFLALLLFPRRTQGRGVNLDLLDSVAPVDTLPPLPIGIDVPGRPRVVIGDDRFINVAEPQVVRDVRDANVSAFLNTIKYAEGTYDQPDPYRVTYAYQHVISDLSDHPGNTGEWKTTTANGITSSAAGAYQILNRSWNDLRSRNSVLTDFSPAMQDRWAILKIRDRRALDQVIAGQFDDAIKLLNQEWASFPGSPYGQPKRSIEDLRSFYTSQGGYLDQQLA